MAAAHTAPSLQIRFARGERPHLFWVSKWAHGATQATRYKVLSKRQPDASLEVVVLQEHVDGTRRRLARETVPAEQPSGWLARWVGELAGSLNAEFSEFDLRGIESREEWRRVAAELGWTLEDDD